MLLPARLRVCNLKQDGKIARPKYNIVGYAVLYCHIVHFRGDLPTEMLIHDEITAQVLAKMLGSKPRQF